MLWYLAAPVKPEGSETVESNLKRAISFQRALLKAGIFVIAPFVEFCHALNDHDPDERKIGIAADMEVLLHCGALVLVGPRVSSGMAAERNLAVQKKMAIVDAAGLEPEEVVEAVLVVQRLAEFGSESVTETYP